MLKDLIDSAASTADYADSAIQMKLVGAIASWCDALHGTTSLQIALSNLIDGLGAEAGMIVRTHLHNGQPIRVAVHDHILSNRPLRTSFADGMFGHRIERPRAASIWLGSACADVVDPVLAEFQVARRLREFCVLVLSASPGVRDHVELHFRAGLSAEVQMTLAAVMPTMARTWAGRQVGLVTRAVVNQRVSRISREPRAVGAVLSIANPAGLSRAESRVCVLLGRGLSVRGVCAELTLAEATVRTHLRNIYAKTGCSSLAELVFRLMTKPQTPAMALVSRVRCA